MRNFLKRWARDLARDDGVAGIVIAMVIAIVAFSALGVFFSKYGPGPGRDLARLQEGGQKSSVARNALMLHLIRQGTLPCPDTFADSDRDGEEDACTGATTSGTLPWRTLGIGRDDAVDAYGRYYTYVVVTDADEREVCTTVDNDYNSEVYRDGSTVESTTLEVLRTTDTAGEGRYVPFVLIGHGANGLGGVVASSGLVMDASEAGASEQANAAAAPTAVFTGPYDTAAATYFDDEVFSPTAAQMQKICEDLSPGGAKNADMTDDFNAEGPAFDATKWTADGGGGDAPTQTGGQAQFTDAGSYLATAAGRIFVPAVRPVYVSAYWTPDAAAASAGFSIATRATPPPTSGDAFATGVTFRFHSTGTIGGANSISIFNNDGLSVGSAADTYALIAGQRYLIETYDNGNDVWSRITQVGDPTNTATVRGATGNTDRGGTQQVVFINGPGASALDDVLIGSPMLTLETGPGAYAEAGAANGSGSGSVTLEVWVRPLSLPTGSDEATILAQWDTADDSDSSFRLYLTAGGAALGLKDTLGATAQVGLGISLAVHQWTHVAVSYDAATGAVHAYKDGALARSAAAALDASGIHAPAEAVAMGADSAGATPFHGQISDVRIWSDVRRAADVATCYQRRLVGAAPCDGADLAANWKLDPTAADGGFSGTLAATAGTAGTLNGAVFTPALAAYFRATAADVCAGFVAGLYRCDYRDPMSGLSVAIPPTVQGVYAKVWGAGGGYSLFTGGGGGFAGGLIDNTGAPLVLTVGEGGGVAADGEDSRIMRSAVLMLEGGGGPGGLVSLILGGIADFLASLFGLDTDDGGIPAAGNDGDPYYPPIGGATTATPGRGGTLGDPSGHDGAIVLLW